MHNHQPNIHHQAKFPSMTDCRPFEDKLCMNKLRLGFVGKFKFAWFFPPRINWINSICEGYSLGKSIPKLYFILKLLDFEAMDSSLIYMAWLICFRDILTTEKAKLVPWHTSMHQVITYDASHCMLLQGPCHRHNSTVRSYTQHNNEYDQTNTTRLYYKEW